ncbi:MAG: hypothetical protein R2729_09315 [Bryobacteraceae bacterium]
MSATQIPITAVERLLRDLYLPPNTIEEVQSFRFVPLEIDKYYLVAVVDSNGRRFFNALAIARCEGGACIETTKMSDGENDLGKQLVDIDGDGRFEIIVRDRISPYEGGHTRPIFRYTIQTLAFPFPVDITSRYPEYYRDHILPMIEQDKQKFEELGLPFARPSLDDPTLSESERRRLLESKPERDLWDAQAAAEWQFIADDFPRRVLGQKETGWDRVLSWITSPYQELQILAMKALDEMGTPAALQKMEEIANWKGEVGVEAQRLLAVRREKAAIQEQEGAKK